MKTTATIEDALETQATGRQQARDAAAAKYRQLVNRDALNDSDAGELARTMAVLGKSHDDVHADLAVVRQAKELREEIPAAKERAEREPDDEAAAAAKIECDFKEKAIELVQTVGLAGRLIVEMQVALNFYFNRQQLNHQSRGGASARYHRLQSALARLESEHADLFGVSEYPETAAPARSDGRRISFAKIGT